MSRSANPERASTKVADWPPCDQVVWKSALDAIDVFEDVGGSRSGHRPLSNRNVERGYGRWLTFLRFHGLLPAEAAPADRITPTGVAAYVEDLERLGNANSTIESRLHELSAMAQLFDPSRDWTFVRRVASRIRARKRQPITGQQRIIYSDQLLDLGLRLMDQAQTSSCSPRAAAVLFRDGLIIALLALRPLRLGNLTQLAIGHQLIATSSGWEILLRPSETKAHNTIAFAWPEVLLAPLQTYLHRHRPHLIARSGRWKRPVGERLWVSSDGSPLIEKAIYDKIRSRTSAAFGFALNPHAFRSAAATSLAVHAPKRVLTGAALLGNSVGTLQRHYNRAQSLEAQRSYSGSIRKLRHG